MAGKKKAPSISKDDAEEYTQSLGQIVAGSWRQVALAKRLGIPEALGLTTEEWVNGRLGGYIRYSIAERRGAVAELAADGYSTRDIGEVLGVDNVTAHRDIVANATPDAEKSNETSTGSDPPVANATPLDTVAALAATEEVKAAAEKKNAQLAKLDPETRKAVEEKVAQGVAVTEAKRQVISKNKVKKQLSGPPGKFRIIYADPPWDYGAHQQPDYHTEQRDHYPVMTIEQLSDHRIRGKTVKEKAEDDAVLFMWVTAPIIEKSFALVHAWGFEYKAQFIWDKIKHNMGHYNSVRHEVLLICTRGSCQPDVRKLFDSVVSIERTEHSRKPDYFYEIIETLYPEGRRIELFHRGAVRPGWEHHGFESEAEAA